MDSEDGTSIPEGGVFRILGLQQYGDERRTIIEDEAAEIHLEDLIADEQVAVTVSHSGYLKRTPVSTYRQQRRGGTGRTGMKRSTVRASGVIRGSSTMIFAPLSRACQT